MPAAGPPSDARSAGGAALVFLCLLLTLQNPKSEGFGGGMATLPKMGMGQKLRSVPYHTCWNRRGSKTKISRKPHMLVIVCTCLYISINHSISNAQRCDHWVEWNWPTAKRTWLAEIPVVPRKAVAEVSKIGHYRRGWLS